MARKRLQWLVALGLAAGIALAACGSDSKSSESTTSKAGGGSGTDLPTCPLSSLDSATAPVEISVWHQFSESNAKVFQKLIDQYNGSQTKVKVTATQLPSYDDILEKYRAGLNGGDLPDLVQMEDTNLQFAVDSKSILPAQSCVNADKYSLDKMLPTSVAYYSIEKVLYGMPFNVSTPVLYYDKSDLAKANLTAPPATFDELKADSAKLKTAGIKVPFAFNIDPWYLDEWRALANKITVNEENGRAGRATKAVFGDETENKIFTTFSEMAKAGTIQGYDRDKFDNMLAIAAGDASMTIYTSAGIGTALDVLQSGGQTDKQLQIGVTTIPKVNADDDGGMAVSGAAFYIVNKSAAAKQAAAWDFEKFLMTANSQAVWSVGSGYVPNNTDAVNDPLVKDAWAKHPEFTVAYTALLDAPQTPATAGIVLGAYGAMRAAIETQLTEVINNGAAPKPAVQKSVADANTAIADYNQRVGAG